MNILRITIAGTNSGCGKTTVSMGIMAALECGGLMYLSKSIKTMDDKEYKMIGLIPGTSLMTSSLQRFGYATVRLTEDTILAPKGSEIRVHEFHCSDTSVDESVRACFEVSKRKNGLITDKWRCGYKKYNLVAGYPHMHFYANPEFAKGFVESYRRILY